MAGIAASGKPLGRRPAPVPVQAAAARAISRDTRQALVFESFRVASISTRSPSLHSLASSCAWYFAERVTVLP